MEHLRWSKNSLQNYSIGDLEKVEIAVSPIHHMREVYIWPNSSGHKADQLTDIQLFQVWSLHSSTFANIEYFFVCVDKIVQTAVKAYYFQSSLRLKLHTSPNTHKRYTWPMHYAVLNTLLCYCGS